MDSLIKALHPKSIAVLGASDNPHKVGGRPIAFMLQYGYRGQIYPVNTSRQTVQGLACYPSLETLPQVPDVAIVAVGGEEGLRLVEACARLGVGAVIVMSSGYGEANEAGKRLQRDMLAACKATGTRLIGPNCQGLANFSSGAIANFSTIFYEQPGKDGPLAIIGQSGAATQSVYALAQERGISSRYVHATGNEADVTVADLLLATLEDQDLRAVVLYIEAINDPHTLKLAAERGRKRAIPIIVIKGGRSENGQRAASSHTGAMATEDRVIDAFVEHHNLIRAADPYEAVSIAALCVAAKRPKGSNILYLSNSGASCVMGADTIDELKLPLLQLDSVVTSELKKALPEFSSPTNPIDLTGALLTDRNLFPGVLNALKQSKEIHLMAVAIPIAGTGYAVEDYADQLSRFSDETGITIAVSAYQASVRAHFIARGLVTYSREREAVQALAAYSRYAQGLTEKHSTSTTQAIPAFSIESHSTTYLSEAQSLHVLHEAGIHTVPFINCDSPEAAVNAFKTFGTNVVLKGCTQDIPHKSEHGLVALNLTREEEIVSAAVSQFSTMQALGARSASVLVAPMIKGGFELALGARIDSTFGPLVLIGAGGIYLEALKDFQLLLPPFSEDEVIRSIRRLHISPILEGVRGEPPADVDAFAKMAVQLGNIMLEWKDRVSSIDVNPVKVMPKGQGAIALDALVELNQTGKST